MNHIGGNGWESLRERLREEAESHLGVTEWLETAQFQLGFGEDIFRPGYLRFKLLANRNGTVDRDLKALYQLFQELEQRFYTAQISLEKARSKIEPDE